MGSLYMSMQVISYKMERSFPYILAFVFINICITQGKICKEPPTAESYQNDKYEGIWYEIGKIQTPGGAFFQRDSVCTIAIFNPYEPVFGNGDIEYSSRKHTPDGPFNNASGVLEAQDEARNGYFKQQLYINGIPTPKVDYRVIHIDDDSAIEYDCTENFLSHDYCIHIMSRTPTMSEKKLQNLLDYADELDLNVDNLDYKTSDQTGCW